MRGLCLKTSRMPIGKGRIVYKKVVRNFDSLEIAHL